MDSQHGGQHSPLPPCRRYIKNDCSSSATRAGFGGLFSTSLAQQDSQTRLRDSVYQVPAQVQRRSFTSVAGKGAPVMHAEIAVLLDTIQLR